VNGTSRLFVNGKLAVPNFLFVNTDTAVNQSYIDQLIHQVSLAKTDANQHLVSMIYWPNFSTLNDDDIKYSDLNRKLDMILSGDPDAQIMLRLALNLKQFAESSEMMKFVDAPNNERWISIASQVFVKNVCYEMARITNYLRTSGKYADHIIGLHIDCSEWFQPGYKEYGLDISEANSVQFRKWLKEKYGTDKAFKAAWGSQYSLDTATVPSDLPANKYHDHYNRTLLLEKSDIRWTDYLDYISIMVTDRILQITKVIKDYSDNQWVTMINYGYFFELGNAASGHHALRRLLDSKYVDLLTSPISYLDRGSSSPFKDKATIAGSTGAYMSTVESVIRAGKIWLFESDDMTYIQKLPGRYMTDEDALSQFGLLKNMTEIYNVHRREAGLCMVNSTGMWPMELRGQGWLDEAKIWENYNALSDLYLKYIQGTKSKATYEVAIVVDEKADGISRQPIQTINPMKSSLRYEAFRMGASVCFVLLDDVIAGKVNDAKMYVFADPYRLTNAEVDKICSIIHKQGKTSVFMYGFGSQSKQNIKKLTGMDIEIQNESLVDLICPNTYQTKIKGLLFSDRSSVVYPRYKVTGGQTEKLGYYLSDYSTGAALYEGKGYNVVFYGSTMMTADSLRAIAKYAGVQVFSDANDVCAANNNMIMLHVSYPGNKVIKFKEKTDVYDYFANKWYENVTQVDLGNLPFGTTKYLFYGKKSDITAMKLPMWTVSMPS